ncbi:hypothetical protein OG840_01330 [Streptomyces sp. NBC_01764]|uniref:hypothetical protein n=1 Tax=Streptomyces sp. NBC_01764 TaxID=2975935 RepID=UPI00225B1F2B|nr:hypothetical protein [Streptomyces sp. NBC_01764]MCX4400477.1 hypothetical protein [Streptomyces sp. NBC_01764]
MNGSWQLAFAVLGLALPGIAAPLAAGFLRYLANEFGKDIIRSHGDRPCSELAKPLLCRPS